MRRLPAGVSLVLLTILAAACSRAPASAPSSGYPGQAPAPAPSVPPPVSSPVFSGAAALLPVQDTGLSYGIREQGSSDFTPVQEYLLREGNRAIAVTKGRPYAVWEIRPDGIWRADPRNPGTLLRYLPPELSDGLIWSQRSGDADVWFRLSALKECDQRTPTCWEVLVLNRGERTAFRFAESAGPISAQADNWAEPARSFEKYSHPEAAPALPAAAERAKWLQGLAAPPAPAPVTVATASQFEDAVFTMLKNAQPSLQTLRLDLNGDDRPDLLQGQLGQWTTTSLQFYHADGRAAGYPQTAGQGRLRVTRLPFPGLRRPAFLIEREHDGELPGVSAIAALENGSMNGWAMEPVYGWAPKSTGAVADRVTWTEDGRITVEWDMGDPARHTRVSQYTWFEEPQRLWSSVKRDSVTYRPEAEALRYPATPKELLQAAFVARWLGLADELPRYFATPEAAAAFAANNRVSEPDYAPGWVQIGALTPQDAVQSCGPRVAEAEPQGPGPHTFAAFWSGYEWCASAWGRVTFGEDAQGRPVIREWLLEDGTLQGH